ncbi:hypothetical protein PMAYCL1PPCAC_18066, partial [Pristionchus mayeri]
KEGERRKEMTYCVDITASAERQDTAEMRERLYALTEDCHQLQMENEELNAKIAEVDRESSLHEEKYGRLQKEREELYREVESRREKEEKLMEENERLLRELGEAIEELRRRKVDEEEKRDEGERKLQKEIEETVAHMQDHIDRVEGENAEAYRSKDEEMRRGEEERKQMKRSIEEKEAEVETVHCRLREVSKELEKIVDEERRNGLKMSRLEREAESYKEQVERTSMEYARMNEELEMRKEKEEELEKRLEKYKSKVVEEAEMIRRANERDESSTQTSLTMEKLSRMEWNKKEMSEGLSRLGRAIEDSFLKKGQFDSHPQRCIDELDVDRLVDIVRREKEKNEENIVTMEKMKKELEIYIEEGERNALRGSTPGEDGDGENGVETTRVDEVVKKYDDPIRQLFFALTHVANNVVQSHKNAKTKMMNGELSEMEYSKMLETMRDLRGQLNDRFSQTSQKLGSGVETGDSQMILRLALVMDANEKLKSRINILVKALRSNWNAEEKAKLLEKVVTEMGEISKTLTTTVGVKQGRIPSSSSAATASTRKI